MSLAVVFPTPRQPLPLAPVCKPLEIPPEGAEPAWQGESEVA